MSLIIFVVAFIIVSYVIVHLANNVLVNNQSSNYITLYIKGTARGSIGLFESNSMLEAKRASLQKKNSKF